MDDEEGDYLFDYGISEVLTQDECLPTEEGIQSIFSRLYDVEDIIYCFGRLTLELLAEPTWEVGLKSLIVINRLLGAAAANLSLSFLDKLVRFINRARNWHHFRFSDGYSDPNIRIYFDFISTWVSYFVKRLECFSRFQFDVVTYRLCAKGLDHAGLSLQLPSLQDLLSKALRCQTQRSLIHNPLVQALLAVVAEDSLKIQNAIREFSDFSTVRAPSAILRQKQDFLDIAITTAADDSESSVEEKHINVVFRCVSDLDTLDDCIRVFAQSLKNTHNWVIAVKILFVIHHALKKMDPQFCANLVVYIKIHNILGFCIGKNPSQKYRTDGELVDVYCEWISTYASYLQNRLEFSYALKYNIASELMKAKELDTVGLFAHMEVLLELCRRALCCHSQGAEVHNSLIQSPLSVVVSEIVEIYNAIRDGLTIMAKTLPELQPHDDHKVYKIQCLAKQQVGELKQLFNPASDIHKLPAEVELFLDKVIDVADENMKINENFEFDVPLKRQRTKEEWASRELGFEPRTVSEHQRVGNMDCGCPIADF